MKTLASTILAIVIAAAFASTVVPVLFDLYASLTSVTRLVSTGQR